MRTVLTIVMSLGIPYFVIMALLGLVKPRISWWLPEANRAKAFCWNLGMALFVTVAGIVASSALLASRS